MSEYDSDTVCSKLDDIEKAVDRGNGWSHAFWWVFLGLIFIFSPTNTNITFNKIWYSSTTAATWDDVTVNKEPTDCDWGRAPIGNKGCSYKKQVSTVRTDINNVGQPIYSYDEGKTWSLITPGETVRPEVVIYWTRAEE